MILFGENFTCVFMSIHIFFYRIMMNNKKIYNMSCVHMCTHWTCIYWEQSVFVMFLMIDTLIYTIDKIDMSSIGDFCAYRLVSEANSGFGDAEMDLL